MRSLLSVLLLLSTSLLAQSAPPKLTVSPTGELTIVTGGTTLVVKADGSVTVKSPAIDLTIPATDNPAPKPVDPVNPVKPDELASMVGTLYGSDADPGKEAKAKTLTTFWYKALSIVDGANTYGDLKKSLSQIPTLPATDLKAIRDLFRDELKKAMGPDPDPVDKVKTRELFARFAKALEALANG